MPNYFDFLETLMQSVISSSTFPPLSMKPDRVRVTVTLEPHVYEIFQRMAKTSRQSMSMCMGEWLGDTADAALAITMQMEKARREPLAALHSIQLYADAVQDGIDALVADAKKGEGREAPPTAQRGGPSRPSTPPSSNTGGKSPKRANIGVSK